MELSNVRDLSCPSNGLIGVEADWAGEGVFLRRSQARTRHPALNRYSISLLASPPTASAAPTPASTTTEAPPQPSPHEIRRTFQEGLQKLDTSLKQDWLDSDCADSHYASALSEEIRWIVMNPVQKYLDTAFWDITRRQLAGEVIEELPYDLWLLWNEYETAHSMYSVLSDCPFTPGCMHDSLVGMRKRISERAERARQFRAAPPEPEETSVVGGGAGGEDDDAPIRCPRCCPDCRGIGCGLTAKDFQEYNPKVENEWAIPAPKPEPPSGGPLVGPFALNWRVLYGGLMVPGGGLAVDTQLDICTNVLKFVRRSYEAYKPENIVHWELRATNGWDSWDLIRLKPREPGDYLDRWNSLDDLQELWKALESVQMSQLPLQLTFLTASDTLGLELTIDRHIPDEESNGTGLPSTEYDGRTPGVIDDPEDDPYYPHDYSRAEEEEMRAFQEEHDREEWDEWERGGGQGCGRCIDVCRCHCYDSDDSDW